MAGPHILVAGDLILDHTVNVSVKGPSPEAEDVWITERKSESHSLGGAGHVLRCIQALGGVPHYIGAAGSKTVVDLLAKSGIPFELATSYIGTTPVKTRFVDTSQPDHGQLLRVDLPGELTFWRDQWPFLLDLASSRADKDKSLDRFHVALIVDYDKGLFKEHTSTLMRALLKDSERIILVDPGRHGDWAKYGSPQTIFKVNLKQAMTFYKQASLPEPEPYMDVYWEELNDFVNGRYDYEDRPPATVCRDMLFQLTREALRAQNVAYNQLVLTAGPHGLVCGSSNTSHTYGAIGDDVDVCDTVGAGDVVLATLAYLFATRNISMISMAEACKIAQRAASLSVQHYGCYAPTYREVFGV